MRVVVTGDFRKSPKVLLDTTQATGVLIATDDGQPTVIFQMTKDGKGWIRLTKGEDKNFNEVAEQLGML